MQLRHRWYLQLAPYRGVRRREPADPVWTFDDWVAAVGGGTPPTRIVVLAAGPSATGYRHREGDLVVATNSSQELARPHPYVYFLAEGFHVDRYIKRGPASSTCRGVFFRMDAAGLPEVQQAVSRRVLAYAGRYVRPVPEVVASNLEGSGTAADNFVQLSAEVLAIVGMPLRQYNSGFGATYLGLDLASRFGASLALYGLDAGVSGHAHFDGSSMQSPSVIGDRVRDKLTEMHDLLDACPVEVVNHSAFRPTPGAT